MKPDHTWKSRYSLGDPEYMLITLYSLLLMISMRYPVRLYTTRRNSKLLLENASIRRSFLFLADANSALTSEIQTNRGSSYKGNWEQSCGIHTHDLCNKFDKHLCVSCKALCWLQLSDKLPTDKLSELLCTRVVHSWISLWDNKFLYVRTRVTAHRLNELPHLRVVQTP